MFWECPDCGYKNDDELIRCVCGYEIGSLDGHTLSYLESNNYYQRRSYAEQWRSYRNLRRAVFISLFTTISAIILGPLTNDIRSPFGAIVLIVMLFGFVISAVTSIVLKTWPCPNCGNTFHWRGIWCWEFSAKCLHCGLPKWAEQDVKDEDHLN